MQPLKFFNLFVILLGFFANYVTCKKTNSWAILVCGYDSYSLSYGMEAAVYKMYNVLVRSGMPKSQIITISPDSVAYNPRNPFPGVVVHATTGNSFIAENQYEDVIIDYKPEDLDPKLFFEILNGNENAAKNITGSGKVLKTGPKDNIFFYIASAGSYGAVVLGRHFLWANFFIPRLEQLKDKKRFAKMFMYIDMENPASMFDNYLETSKNIIVYTSGGRLTSMYLTKKNNALDAFTGTFASEVFFTSLERMQSPDGKNLSTIFDHYILARNEALTDLDPLGLYGTLKLGNEKMSNFIGKSFLTNFNTRNKIKASRTDSRSEIITLKKAFEDSDIISKSDTIKLKNKLETIIFKSLESSQYSMEDLETAIPNLLLEKYDCYKSTFEAVRSSCFTEKNQIILFSYGEKFAKMCGFGIELEKMVQIARDVCK